MTGTAEATVTRVRSRDGTGIAYWTSGQGHLIAFLGRGALMAAARFEVRSADGTSLAVWVDGHGPPLVLVHAFDPLVAELRDALTTFSMDRRGFGASGDAAGYAIEREFEDVAAVVEAVAARTGGPVALWGHSYGAGCAMGGAALTAGVHHLVLYEPGLGIAYPAGSIPGARVQVLEGHAHLAYRTDPAMVAAVIRRFVSGRGCRGCGRPRRS